MKIYKNASLKKFDDNMVNSAAWYNYTEDQSPLYSIDEDFENSRN